MNPQATRCTQSQLAYLSYWTSRGYKFGRNDVIPESTTIKPQQWFIPSSVELAFSAACIAVIFAALYFKGWM